MYDDLKGKTALITGAGKKTGIGLAIAEKMASCGANVILADLGKGPESIGGIKMGLRQEMESMAGSLKEKHGVKTLAVDLDVTRNDSLQRMMEKIKEHFDCIDALVNNAGASFGAPSPVQTYDEEAWMKTIDVNLHGTFRVSRAILPMMTRKPAAIVNIASRAGKTPPLANGAYAVAKAGVIMLTKVMALELARQGIRVNAICPGIIMTDLQVYRFEMEAKFLRQTSEEREKAWANDIPQGRIGAPADVADLAVYLSSKESGYITGQAINVDGGLLMAL
ncbi:MAG: SDR family NAD(P)-dependent oxidoreductase [Thermodesulfobacteriota bacterium]|jgi:NAD(P)-dependent dehydrogenase (short-subunit alcohol dehydrogenase family)